MIEFDFSTFPTLTTPRLILRQSVPEDAADLLSYLSDPELAKYDVYTPMSVALMRTLGFQHEGTRRECGLNTDGTYHSWGLYGMLENEYAC